MSVLILSLCMQHRNPADITETSHDESSGIHDIVHRQNSPGSIIVSRLVETGLHLETVMKGTKCKHQHSDESEVHECVHCISSVCMVVYICMHECMLGGKGRDSCTASFLHMIILLG